MRHFATASPARAFQTFKVLEARLQRTDAYIDFLFSVRKARSNYFLVGFYLKRTI